MEQLLEELMQNGREDFLLAGVAVMTILMLVQLHKIRETNKKIDSIVRSVEGYLNVILAEDDAAEGAAMQAQEEARPECDFDEREGKSEAQNRLISSVLQEIFP